MATRAQRAESRGKRAVPPLRAAKTLKNNQTSAKKVTLEKNKVRALQLRERGLTYLQISQIMGKPLSSVQEWVSDSLDQMIVEPAMRLLKLELAKLDTIMAKLWPRCMKGDIAAQKVFLNYHRHRAILLGLYPRDGKQPVNIALINNAGTTDNKTLGIEFVMPGGRKLALDALDAEVVEEISPDEFERRPRQERPLPPERIDHQTNNDQTNKVDTMRPREPRPVVPEYQRPTGTEFDGPAQRPGGTHGPILDVSRGGGKGWLK
jgi:hypothetical protein